MTHSNHRGSNARFHLFAMGVVVLLLASVPLSAQTVDVTRAGQTFEVRCTASVPQEALIFGRALGYDTASLADGDFLAEPGKPQVPTQVLRIALPAGMTVTGVRVLAAETVELPGEYLLFPAQPPRRLSDAPTARNFVSPDPATYSSAVAYPSETVAFIQQTDLAGQALGVVQLRPVRYVAAERKITLCTSTTFALDGVAGYVCGDYLPPRISAMARDYYERSVTAMAINPAAVELQSRADLPAGTRGVAPGDYDYVIITPNAWVSAFQPLANWKTQKGVPANIVTTEWIYANYSGTTNVDKIRAFVQDAYTQWGTTFFLLGGDTAYVPCNTRTFASVDPDPVPNDTYYADFDDDWTCEVHVGRASVINTGTGAGGIGAFINKVLTYEKNPPSTNYARKAAFFGFDLDASTHAEQCKTTIRSSYVPAAWTVSTVYDSQTGNHRTNVIAAVNAGQMIINHADHSNPDVMGVGYVNHNWNLFSSDVDAFTNGSRQSIWYSIGCDPAAFDASNCIAEHFVRNVNGGGLAFIGNSRYGFFNSGSYNTYSMRYDQYFFRSLFPENYYRLGTAFSDHKNDFLPGDDYYKYTFTELTLLGDPELPVWTDTPQTATATYPATVNVGVQATFAVQVSSGGSPVASATVCLWKAGDVYLLQQTNAAGSASFVFTPQSVGNLYVTVTKENYLPYEGTATVVQATYTLTTSVTGQGSIALDPPGGTYLSGTTVQVTANHAAGWHFDHWTGDLTGATNPSNILMDGNKSVTAVFVQDQYTLATSVSPAGKGNVMLSPPGGVYLSGTTVQLTAVAIGGWHFLQWTGDLTSSTSPTTMVMDGNKSVTAVFVQDQYTLTTNVTGQGSIALDPPGGTYLSGTTVQVTANHAAGWHFDHWTGDLTGTTNPSNILMDGNKSVTAVFVQDQYTLTTNVTGSGSIALDPPGGTYLSGTSVQVTANHAAGWHFDHWTGDLTGTTNPSNIVMDGNKSVTAAFVQNPLGCPGDMNCDGQISFADIDLFVEALSGQSSWTHAPCPWLNADCNHDLNVTFADIDPFVALIGTSCP